MLQLWRLEISTEAVAKERKISPVTCAEQPDAMPISQWAAVINLSQQQPRRGISKMLQHASIRAADRAAGGAAATFDRGPRRVRDIESNFSIGSCKPTAGFGSRMRVVRVEQHGRGIMPRPLSGRFINQIRSRTQSTILTLERTSQIWILYWCFSIMTRIKQTKRNTHYH